MQDNKQSGAPSKTRMRMHEVLLSPLRGGLTRAAPQVYTYDLRASVSEIVSHDKRTSLQYFTFFFCR